MIRAHALPVRAPAVVVDLGERLSADDLASQREAEFLAAALHVHAARAQRALRGFPGVCSNCGGHCLPCAVYCDAECRGDHEARVAAVHRTRPRGSAA